MTLRALIPVLPYHEPKKLKNYKRLTNVLKSCRVASVLLVTDAVIHRLGLTQPLEKSLKEVDIKIALYDGTDPNPTTKNIEAATKIYNQNACQAIIAFGGGSAMDCGKATGIRIARPNKPLGEMEGILKVHHALTHTIEAYIGRSTTKQTRQQALEAIHLIFHNIETAYKDGANLKARAKMLEASYLAGLAFTKSYVGYVHAMAHALGGKYDVPHGLANAVLLPYVLDRYRPKIDKKLYEIAVQAGIAQPSTSETVAADLLIQKIVALDKNMKLGTNIPELCAEDIPKLARTAEKEANPLYPVPVLWDATEIAEVYKEVLRNANA